MTISTMPSNPNLGAFTKESQEARNQTPESIEKQLYQLLINARLPNTIRLSLSRAEQLTLSCLIQKVRDGRYIKGASLVHPKTRLIENFNKYLK